MHKAKIPDIEHVVQHLDITVLPSEVGKRIEDMRRAGYILSEYVRDKQFRDTLYSEFNKIRSLCRSNSWHGDHNCDECFSLADSIESKLYPKYDDNSDFDCDQTVDIYRKLHVTPRICNRLSVEVQLMFLRRAIEALSKKDKSLLEKDLLIDCLRHMRNIVVHRKNIDVKHKYFEATASGVKMRFFPGLWFLQVSAKDLQSETRPNLNSEVAEWFERQCAKWPVDFLLDAAVERLCAHFTSGTRRVMAISC